MASVYPPLGRLLSRFTFQRRQTIQTKQAAPSPPAQMSSSSTARSTKTRDLLPRQIWGGGSLPTPVTHMRPTSAISIISIRAALRNLTMLDGAPMIRLYTALMAILPVGRIGQVIRTWVVRVLAGLLVDKSFRDCQFRPSHSTASEEHIRRVGISRLSNRQIRSCWMFVHR